MKNKSKILITGCSGFIGFHVCLSLLKDDSYDVYGLDNMNDYYDIELKKDRLKILKKNPNFKFFKINIEKYNLLSNNFNKNKYDYVVHLAAQAGVRFSIENRKAYLDSNLIGFYNILEVVKSFNVKHLVYASSSSVYGSSTKYPFKESDKTDTPLSFYAASKKSNESLAFSYSNIFGLPMTGLRFFTVYGPYGRPDMALYIFANSILKNTEIKLFNKGNHERDFTYVDDVVKYLKFLIKRPSQNKIPHAIYNIGSNNPIKLRSFILIIENILNRKSKKTNFPMQPGDVKKTHASMTEINKLIKFKPTNIKDGIKIYLDWFLDYYNK